MTTVDLTLSEIGCPLYVGWLPFGNLAPISPSGRNQMFANDHPDQQRDDFNWNLMLLEWRDVIFKSVPVSVRSIETSIDIFWTIGIKAASRSLYRSFFRACDWESSSRPSHFGFECRHKKRKPSKPRVFSVVGAEDWKSSCLEFSSDTDQHEFQRLRFFGAFFICAFRSSSGLISVQPLNVINRHG